MRKKKPPISKREIKPLQLQSLKSLPPRFEVSTLQKASDDIKSGKLKIKKEYHRVSDHERGTGLRAHVYENYWSYFVEYNVRGKSGRIQVSIGKHPQQTLEDARNIAKMIQRLAKQGIDIKDDEQWLEEHGIKTWRRSEPKPAKDIPESLDDATLRDLKLKARRTEKRERLTREYIHVQAYPTGKVVFAVEYSLPNVPTRMHVTIGDWPEMSVEDAQYFATVIRDLGMRGIDVQWGLHTRLLLELKRDGVNWRPTLSQPPEKK